MGVIVYVLQYISHKANCQANKENYRDLFAKDELQRLSGKKGVYKTLEASPQNLGLFQLCGTAVQPYLGWLAVPLTSGGSPNLGSQMLLG